MNYQLLLCLCIFVAVLTNVSGHCRDYWVSFRGHCYRHFNTKPVEWHIAEHACSSTTISGMLGHLVSIEDDAEDQFVASITAKSTSRKAKGPVAWIGLHYNHNDRQFQWTDGEEYGYRGWRGGAPPHRNSRYCIVINSPYRADWNDQPCLKTYGYVCEMPSLDVSTSEIMV